MESNSQYQQCASPRETNSFEQYPADAGTCTVQNGLPADGLKNIFCKNVVHIIFSPMYQVLTYQPMTYQPMADPYPAESSCGLRQN